MYNIVSYVRKEAVRVCRSTLGRGVALTVALLMLIGGVAGCGAVGGESFGFALSAEPQQIDPQVARDTASLTVIAAVFEGLTALDDNGEPIPAAAEWTVSEDGLLYTFRLRESYWSTVSVRGEETGFEEAVQVTAHDFVFGIRRTADPATASPYADQLAGIVNAQPVCAGSKSSTELGVEAVDDETLTIRLSAPDSDFLKKLAGPGFMPCNREFFAYTAGRYGLEKQYILTNGPFAVTAWSHHEAVSLTKNPFYHRAEEILPASVRYRITKTEEEDFDLLTKGYLDAAAVPSGSLEEARSAELQLVELQDTIRFLWMNNQIEVFQNADIRRAVRDAIEYETLWNSLPKGCVKASGFVSPAATLAGGAVYRDRQNSLPFGVDQAAAQASLAEGLGQLELEKMPTLTLLAAEDDDSANLARYILQSLSKNLGVRCALELTDAATLAARVQAGNYQLAIADVTARGLTAYENLSMFTAGAPANNYARFAAADFDGRYATAGPERAQVQALEQALFESCPSVPLGFVTRYYGVGADVTGVEVRPFDGGTTGALLSFFEADRVGS